MILDVCDNGKLSKFLSRFLNIFAQNFYHFLKETNRIKKKNHRINQKSNKKKREKRERDSHRF